MTIKPDNAEPCWEPVRVDTGEGYWHDNERWPHYETKVKCDEAITEILSDNADEPLALVAAKCFESPCVVLVCDECGDHFDYEDDGGMHFDPADPMPVPITDCGWVDLGNKHYHDECAPGACEDCDERHGGDCDPLARPVEVSDDQGVLL